MDRKKFIKQTVATAIGLPLVASVIGCSDDSSDSNPTTNPPGGGGTANCLENGTNVNIGSNHGHSLTVSKEDVSAGAQKTYSIDGSSGHSHTVTISANDFQSLQQNSTISVNSSTGDGHTHNINVSCA